MGVPIRKTAGTIGGAVSDKVSVLIVDDSALMRSLIKRIVSSHPELEVAGIAMNGRFAQQKLPSLKPHVMVLDLEMPEVNGIEFLKWREQQGIEIPVIILSAIATQGAKVTMEALDLGASDFITKPQGSGSDELRRIGDELNEKLLAYGRDYQRRQDFFTVGPTEGGISDSSNLFYKAPAEKSEPVAPRPIKKTEEPKKIVPKRNSAEAEVVAIGISTGGPNALRKVFPQLSADLPVPILVVQHMPAGFTKEFANSLNKICPLEVKEAEDGDLLKPGRVLIAPGDRHLVVEKRRLATIARLEDRDSVNGHKPSVGVLFNSIAENYENKALGIIMTGMGKDGSREMGRLLEEGSRTFAQDESSSVVFGMPRVAIELGHAQRVVALDEIAQIINQESAK